MPFIDPRISPKPQSLQAPTTPPSGPDPFDQWLSERHKQTKDPFDQWLEDRKKPKNQYRILSRKDNSPVGTMEFTDEEVGKYAQRHPEHFVQRISAPLPKEEIQKLPGALKPPIFGEMKKAAGEGIQPMPSQGAQDLYRAYKILSVPSERFKGWVHDLIGPSSAEKEYIEATPGWKQFHEKWPNATEMMWHIGQKTTGIVSDPFNWPFLVGGPALAEAAPEASAAINWGFAALQTANGLQAAYSGTQKAMKGDGWGAGEDFFDALVSGAFAFGAGVGGVREVRTAKFLGAVNALAEDHFGRGWKDLNDLERDSISGAVIDKFNQPKYKAVINKIKKIELTKDLKAVKRFRDAQRVGKSVELPARMRNLEPERVEFLGDLAEKIFKGKPSTWFPLSPPVGFKDIDETSVRRFPHKELNRLRVWADLRLMDRDVPDAERADLVDKQIMLEQEWARRGVLAAENSKSAEVRRDPLESLAHDLESAAAHEEQAQSDTWDAQDAQAAETTPRPTFDASAAVRAARARRSAIQDEAREVDRLLDEAYGKAREAKAKGKAEQTRGFQEAIERHRAKRQALDAQLRELDERIAQPKGRVAEGIPVEGKPLTQDEVFDNVVAAAKKELSEEKAADLEGKLRRYYELVKLRMAARGVIFQMPESSLVAGRRLAPPPEVKQLTAGMEELTRGFPEVREAVRRAIQGWIGAPRLRRLTPPAELGEGSRRLELPPKPPEDGGEVFKEVSREIPVEPAKAEKAAPAPQAEAPAPVAAEPIEEKPARLLPHEWDAEFQKQLGSGQFATEPEIGWARQQVKGLLTKETAKQAADALNAKKAAALPIVELPPAQLGAATKMKVKDYTVDGQWAVVPAKSIIHSFDKRFPQELQPRNREAVTSEEQINEIYNKLDPNQIGQSYLAGDGAPVVGPDMAVEVGNGRVEAIKRLYKDNHPNASKYKDWQIENASKFGLTPEAIKAIEDPVLVRIRRSEVNRERFAEDANVDTKAQMSATEQAKVDAKRLPDEVIALLSPSDAGDIFNAQNQPFINAFLSQFSAGERKGLVEANGLALSQDGMRRIKNAIFARAYPGAELALQQMSESGDPNILNVVKGMLNAAPRMVVLADGIANETHWDLSLAGEIDRASAKLSALRDQAARQGVPAKTAINDWLAQRELGGMESDSITKELVRLFAKYARSPRSVADVLDYYAEQAILKGRRDQGALFGGGEQLITREGLLREAISQVGEPQAEMFGELPPPLATPPVAPEAPGPMEPPPPVGGEEPLPRADVKLSAKEISDAVNVLNEKAKAQGDQRGYVEYRLAQANEGIPILKAEYERALASGDREAEKFVGEKYRALRLEKEAAQRMMGPKKLTSPKQGVGAEDLYRAGKSIPEIAKTLGIPYQDAFDKIEKAGLIKRVEPQKLTPPGEAPKKFGESNTLFTSQKLEEATKRAMEKARRLQAGIPLDLLPDLIEIGGYYFEGGVRKFADWSAKMVDHFGELGEKIRPMLWSVWDSFHEEIWKRAGTDPEMKKYVQSIMKGGEKDVDLRQPEKAPGGKDQPGGGRVLGGPLHGGRAEGPSADEAGGRAPRAGRKPKPDFVPTIETRAPAGGTPIVSEGEWKNTVYRYFLDPDTPRPTEDIDAATKAKLFPNQRPVVQVAMTSLVNNDAALVADVTGSGKTHEGSALIRNLLDRMGEGQKNARTLIISPRSAYDKWRAIAFNYGLEVRPYPTNVTVPEEPGVYIATYDQATSKPGIDNGKWDIVLADESHYAKRWWESGRGAMLQNVTKKAGKAIFTSASPFSNALQMGYLDKLGLWKPGQFEAWAGQFGAHREARGWVSDHNPKKFTALQLALIKDGRMVTREHNLEGLDFSSVMIPLTDSQRSDMASAGKAFDLAYSYFKMRGAEGKARSTLGNRVNYMKSFLERAKVGPVIEMMKKANAAGWKAVAFAESKSDIDVYEFLKEPDEYYKGEISRIFPKLPGIEVQFKSAFGDDIGIFTGTASAARQRELDSFNNDSTKNLLTTFGVGSISVDMHDLVGDKPRVAFYLGPPWSEILFDQSFGRFPRAGAMSSTWYVIPTSDSQAEFDTLTNKVLPRLKALRAIVKGVESDKLTDRIQSNAGVIAYSVDEKDPSPEAFNNFLSARGVKNYKEMKILSADEAKNKPRTIERPLAPLNPPPKPPGEGGATLYSGIDPFRAVHELRSLGRDLRDVLKGGKERMSLEDAQEALRRFDKERGLGVDLGSLKGAIPDEAEAQKFTDSMTASARQAAIDNPEDPAGAGKREMQGDLHSLETANELIGPKDKAAPEVRAKKGLPIITRAEARMLLLGGRIGPTLVEMKDTYFERGRTYQGSLFEPLYKLQVELKPTVNEWRNAFFMGEDLTPDERKKWIKHITTHAGRDWGKPMSQEAAIEWTRTDPISPKAAKMAPVIRQFMNEAFEKLGESGAGVEVGGKFKPFSDMGIKASYMPHMYDRDVYDPGKTHIEGVKEKLQRERGFSKVEAEEFVETGGGRRVPLQGNIERPRTDWVPGYRVGFTPLWEYSIQQAEARARAEVFGPHREKLDADSGGILKEIASRDDRKAIQEAFDSFLVRNPVTSKAAAFITNTGKVWAGLHMYRAPLAALTHSTKGAFYLQGSGLADSLTSFWGGWLDTIAKNPLAKENVVRVGGWDNEYADSVLRAIATTKEETRGMPREQRTVSGHMMQRVGLPLVNRAVNAALDAMTRRQMNTLLGRFRRSPNNLHPADLWLAKKRLGITDGEIREAIANGVWKRETLDKASARTIQAVQMTGDPTKEPGWMNLPVPGDENTQIARAFWQNNWVYKHYLTKSIGFNKDMIADAIKAGNPKIIIPYLWIGPLVGIPFLVGREALRGSFKTAEDIHKKLEEGNYAGLAEDELEAVSTQIGTILTLDLYRATRLGKVGEWLAGANNDLLDLMEMAHGEIQQYDKSKNPRARTEPDYLRPAYNLMRRELPMLANPPYPLPPLLPPLQKKKEGMYVNQ